MKPFYNNSFAMFELGKALCTRYNAEKPMYTIYAFCTQYLYGGRVNQ